MQWKKPEEEMPKDEQQVLALVQDGKFIRMVMATHISAHSVLAEDFLNDDYDCSELQEYDEKEDQYYCRENWFESNSISEENYLIGDPVIAWAHVEIPEEFKKRALKEATVQPTTAAVGNGLNT